MTLFRSTTHQELWRQHWCERCFQAEETARRLHGKDTQCPIWEKALRTGRKPPEWDRMPRADTMDRSIRCNAYTPTPPVTRRGTAEAEDVPLFDVEPAESKLVPVEGWPDRPPKDGVEHQ